MKIKKEKFILFVKKHGKISEIVPHFVHTAFRGMIKVAKRYPELFDEIKVLLDNSYIDTLTPGVKSSIVKLANKYW